MVYCSIQHNIVYTMQCWGGASPLPSQLDRTLQSDLLVNAHSRALGATLPTVATTNKFNFVTFLLKTSYLPDILEIRFQWIKDGKRGLCI